MKLLKLSIFSLVCAILLCIMRQIVQIEPLVPAAMAMGCLSVLTFVMWICLSLVNTFKYSLNCVAIFFFAVLSFACYVLNPEKISIQTLNDIQNLGMMSAAFVISLSLTFLSIICLAGRMIFFAGGDSLPEEISSTNTTE